MERLSDHIPDCPPEFADLEVVFEASWSDFHEECGSSPGVA